MVQHSVQRTSSIEPGVPATRLLRFRAIANFSFPGGVKIAMPQNFWKSLAAVLIGNVLYFACSGFLPPAARHNTAGFDLGLVVDFWFCLVVLGLLELLLRHKKDVRRPKVR